MPKPQFPLTGQRAFLEVLAPYLPYDIDVYHPSSTQYGRLKGLPGTYEGQGLPLADVEFYVSYEARQEGGGDLLEDVSKVLPVLYSFEDLATELELADGRRVVPAVEVAKLLLGQEESYISDAAFHGMKHYAGFIEVYYNGALLLIQPDGTAFYDDKACVPMNAAKYLRSQHFAVGLEPAQYHRKQVAAKTERNCELEGCAVLLGEKNACPGCIAERGEVASV